MLQGLKSFVKIGGGRERSGGQSNASAPVELFRN